MGRPALALALAFAVALSIGGSAPSPVPAHPGHGADTVTVDGDNLAFRPATVKIATRDTVIWYWQGALFRNHSVTADEGQAESFDSDPGRTPTNSNHPRGDTFVHTFKRPGRFTYHCKVHPQMRGVIEVRKLPQRRPPKLGGLRISAGVSCSAAGCRARKAVARFDLTRGAAVVGRIARLRGSKGRQVKTFTRRVPAGRNRLPLPTGKLAAGRYRLSLVAYDAGDRRSNRVRGEFRIKRGR